MQKMRGNKSRDTFRLFMLNAITVSESHLTIFRSLELLAAPPKN